MSPKYASNGHFSVKSDAFSFGVLVLEIVSGKTNRGFRHLDPNLNLLGHAWMLWIKGTPFELIDECLAESCNSSDIIRCIHVALLCVQQRPEDRPDMSAVVLILGSEIPLPQPM
uniref:Serine-threonine/tyrosine-protein kinase catalytic domain-containing protein n=1 Tax=Salix viminalis TaxID=40686 RepID=A0A6N2MX35_SALVM